MYITNMLPITYNYCESVKNLLIQCSLKSNKLNECTILKSIFNSNCKKNIVHKSSK
jgi:hypothetical protein